LVGSSRCGNRFYLDGESIRKKRGRKPAEEDGK
jgi:hypothetical protein